ncbi:hypothetical protein HHK36_005290 [Tetracentron sinense]|uniref:Targeting protein for Xklp2 n=1 Tax=Tetracentron sinense TaxID=13715 RepID=A0A835DMN9_TETSI|nr:hypothetical protein HHK36_005290 [Tetracentron sinense]
MAVEDCNAMIDETYEFSAPRFFDFINGESKEEMQRAELWFETALSCAPSPFMPKIKGRSVQIETLCDFSEAEQHLQKASGSSDPKMASTITDEVASGLTEENSTRLQCKVVPVETRNEEEEKPHKPEENRIIPVEEISVAKQLPEDKDGKCTVENGSASTEKVTSVVETGKSSEKKATSSSVVSSIHATEACTPKPQRISGKGSSLPTDSKKTQTAKKIASLVRNPSSLKPKNQSQLSQAKSVKNSTSLRAKTAKNNVAVPDFAQENQAIKKQKLEGGRFRQILNFKSQNLPHKSKGLSNSAANLCSSITKTRKEDRKVYVREPAVPFVSMAEMVKRFQSKTRGINLPHNKSLSHDDAASVIQRKPRLTLTRPKEPEFETAHRVRSVRVKSSAELEEEMMAKIPKFKARPVNKKIMEAPTLPALPRSTPQLPEFQEFHLKTMERANQHAETSTVVSSTDASCQNQGKSHKLTEPRTPHLETSLRARPTKVKSSQELEQEELEKVPKFKARPLNKKIFESKGELGMFCNSKRQVTKPQEFHFATDDRIPLPIAVIDLFDKLSLNSESRHDQHQFPRITTPNPFYLHTEERGAEKERKFVVEVLQKQFEEERARIPKATPYPYTTDYPVIPPKPEPKQCTRPEPFQLESLVRHDEEMQREMEERQRIEKEEAQMRQFKAQPVMKEDPIPVPEKERKPLTQVQEFVLHVDHRAVDREEFDKKIKEKEMMYKRYREEYESEKMMEEEKALKQMRRTMVPHARPIPNFEHPFHPHKSTKETTKPKSPNLRVIRRKEERRRLVGAAHMR